MQIGSRCLRLIVFVQSIIIGWWLLQHFATLFLRLHDAHKQNITKETQQLQYQKIHQNASSEYQYEVGGDVRSFALGDVKLSEDSYHWQCMDSNAQYLMNLDPDRLLYVFRANAGLSVENAQPFNGTWEAPNCELRGHFVGHYLSALAMLYQSQQRQEVKQRLMYMVSELEKVQASLKEDGYLSAFPSSQLQTLETLQPVWAPYYTLHKILAGLLDSYQLAGIQQALEMATQFAGYIHTRVSNIYNKPGGPRKWLQILEVEFGGMNDVMYRMYEITGNQNDLWLAQRFDKPSLYQPLVARQDPLDGLHANTHIPQVLGLIWRQDKNQLSDNEFRKAAEYFFYITTEQHGYSTGGTSVSEHWKAPYRAGDAVSKRYSSSGTQETCTSYNMLKLARQIFQWTGRVSLVDYYERLLLNGILSTTRIHASTNIQHNHHHHHHHDDFDSDHHHHNHHHNHHQHHQLQHKNGHEEQVLENSPLTTQMQDGGNTGDDDRSLLNLNQNGFDYRQVHRNLAAKNTPLSIQTIVSSDSNEFDDLIYNGSVLEPTNEAGPGVYLYLLPLGVANRKDDSWSGWGFPYGSFWCCYGTAIESFTKLQDSLYFWRQNEDQIELFINQFVSSVLTWDEQQITLNMQSNIYTVSGTTGQVRLQIDTKKKLDKQLVIQLRIPEWVEGGKIVYNNRTLQELNECFQYPASYCKVQQDFYAQDVLEIQFSLGIRTEKIQDTRQAYQGLHSILVGPHVMVGVTQQSKMVAGNPSDISKMVQTVSNKRGVYRVQLHSVLNSRLQIVLHRNYLYFMDMQNIKLSKIESTIELQEEKKNSKVIDGICQVRIGVMSLPGAWLSVGSSGHMKFTYNQKKASVFTIIPRDAQDGAKTVQITIPSLASGTRYMSLYFGYDEGNNASVLGCQDFDDRCSDWATKGECQKNGAFMMFNCRKSCESCGCGNSYKKCKQWSKMGECEDNPTFMLQNCPLACQTCGGVRLGMAQTNKHLNATSFIVSREESTFPTGTKLLVSNGNVQEETNQFQQKQFLLIPMAYVVDERYTVYFEFQDGVLSRR